MKFIQEYIAENLFKNLEEIFKIQSESINVTIEGSGVHWHCCLEKGKRRSKIHCFEDRFKTKIRPEYLISYEESNVNKAWGRTYDIQEVIQSSNEWIGCKMLEELYTEFEFIDWYKRRILTIEEQLIASEPELEKVARDLDLSWGSGLYDFQMNYKSRSCTLKDFGKEAPLSFLFKWDECDLFEVKQSETTLLAEVVRKWLLDEINPSELERQYDWIIVGDLARYYERGEGIKGEFIESWNSIEKYYEELSDEYHSIKDDALGLIQEMREYDLDKELRAGQSLFLFILSRARRHGLKEKQAYLQITFLGDKRIRLDSNLKDVECLENVEAKYDGLLKEQIQKILKIEIE